MGVKRDGRTHLRHRARIRPRLFRYTLRVMLLTDLRARLALQQWSFWGPSGTPSRKWRRLMTDVDRWLIEAVKRERCATLHVRKIRIPTQAQITQFAAGEPLNAENDD